MGITDAPRYVATDEPTSTHKDVMESMVEQWTKVAVSQATTESIKDPDGMVATIVGIDGPWAFGQTGEEAIKELESVLIDWVTMKLEDGDKDIPHMEGVYLVADGDES